jgi:hypothetical protein
MNINRERERERERKRERMREAQINFTLQFGYKAIKAFYSG